MNAQRRGRGRPPKHYEFRGRLYTIAELSKLSGLKCMTLYRRLQHGWSVERVMTEGIWGPSASRLTGGGQQLLAND